MTKKKHICFIVPDYPTHSDPVYTFVKQVVDAIAKMGYSCSVVAPQSLTKNVFKKKSARPLFWQDCIEAGIRVDVYQPRVLSFSNISLFGRNISASLAQKAVIRCFKQIKPRPDLLYAHFWHSGVTAGLISQKYQLPLFVATGESKIWVESLFPRQTIDKALAEISGVICASTKNRNESLELKLSTPDKMVVIPNAIDPEKFYKMERMLIRRKLGFKEDDFIVVFMGSFDQRKGIMRLSEAMKQVNPAKVIYIGSGELIPTGDEILFIGRLPHDQIVNYLNAADVFVLPTLAEGCSNAILEAMACGLPIISSDQGFNDDILTPEDSIRIDCMDVNAIAKAINKLKNDAQLRSKMSESALTHSQLFHINNRASRIMNFIENVIDEKKEV
ncbi:glycosyltransferase family 4 protein [Acetobacterium wieringae]|uniref:glycosyltransferase family 4 protein n=1 Tax=Acetobacterium wieringae TaxID=52694 RepID=UPI002B2074E4|nr:glycosyltransferase family 4 protein [Acetobacterium wieringae]MEA4805511.1 glycosyltransferase family 4 protein [Acetobacterium wieringae]